VKNCVFIEILRHNLVMRNILFFVVLNVYLLTKLRSGTLQLNIELDRYNNTPRESRLCLCCNMNVAENE
jgi:hypothetical protein